MTLKAQGQPATWMLKVGVILVVGLLAFSEYIIHLDAFGVIDVDVTMYQWAMTVTAVVVSVGLFAGSQGLARLVARIDAEAVTAGCGAPSAAGSDNLTANGDGAEPVTPAILKAEAVYRYTTVNKFVMI